MNNSTTSTELFASTNVYISQTFVEQHSQTIANLYAFITAVENYIPGVAGANAALQEAMRALHVPTHINMKNAVEWARNAIQTEEKSLALELQKETALSTLKAAERNRRDAERLAQRARKAWAALTVNPIVATGPTRKSHASNACHHSVAA